MSYTVVISGLVSAAVAGGVQLANHRYLLEDLAPGPVDQDWKFHGCYELPDAGSSFGCTFTLESSNTVVDLAVSDVDGRFQVVDLRGENDVASPGSGPAGSRWPMSMPCLATSVRQIVHAGTVGGARHPDSILAAPEPFRERLRQLVDAFVEEETDDRGLAMAERAVEAVNAAMWRELHRLWSIEACGHVDRLATRLESGTAPERAEIDAEAMSDEVGAPPWVALQVGWLVAASSVHPVGARPRAAARILRAFGLAVCVEHGVAARCPCLLHRPAPVRGPEHALEESQSTAGDDQQHDADAQVFFDVLVETVLLGIRDATAGLAWEVVNGAVAKELDAQWSGDVVAALNGVASALDALREALRDGARTGAGYVVRRSGLPPWARQVATQLVVSLAGLPVNTQLHIAALGLRVLGACLEIELSAQGRAVATHEIVDDPRVRPTLVDLWDVLEPLHLKQGIVMLLIDFDYGEGLVGVLEPLRRPARSIASDPVTESPTLGREPRPEQTEDWQPLPRSEPDRVVAPVPAVNPPSIGL